MARYLKKYILKRAPAVQRTDCRKKLNLSLRISIGRYWISFMGAIHHNFERLYSPGFGMWHGRDVYVVSKLVGENGMSIGIDMTMTVSRCA